MPTEAPVRMPTVTPTREPEPRPYYDPDTVREPDKICPQQRRELGWTSV